METSQQAENSSGKTRPSGFLIGLVAGLLVGLFAGAFLTPLIGGGGAVTRDTAKAPRPAPGGPAPSLADAAPSTDERTPTEKPAAADPNAPREAPATPPPPP